MKKKNVLITILAIVVVAVVLFLIFRNKTKEGMEQEENWQKGFILAAREGGHFSRQGNGTIRYGRLDGGGGYKEKRYSKRNGKVRCSNKTFGDPARGHKKGCYFKYDNTWANMKLKMNEQLAQARQKNPAAFVGIKDIGNSFRCKHGTKPVGQKYAADERHIYRGEFGNKLKHYESPEAALLYGGESYRKRADGGYQQIETINCGTKTYGGKHRCDESGKGQAYRGCRNKTRKGTICRSWDAGGRGGSRNYIKNLFNDAQKVEEYGLGSGTGKYKMANNFCRTPEENENGKREKKPWCYTSKLREKGGWGYCF